MSIIRETLDGVYELQKPQEGNSLPLVFDSPHSGRIYPPDFHFICPKTDLQKSEDNNVDDLFDRVAYYRGTFLHALFPRSYIDVNRAIDDIEPEIIARYGADDIAQNPTDRAHAGIGLIHRITRPGIPIYDRRLSGTEIRHRITTYYCPYHAALEQEIDSTHYRFGQVWHINCHSMPATGRPTGFVRNSVSHSLADFVLGDRSGTSCDLHVTHSIRDFLRSLGYRVDINMPYKGVEIVRRYGQPATGRHSLQIEINKALYWDEQSHSRNRNYDNLKSDIEKLIAYCAAYVQDNLTALAAD